MGSDDIQVETMDSPVEDGPKKAAVIIDRKANRAWSGEGATTDAAVTKAVRRLLGDRRARKYVG